jgi:hypothetical protein
MLNKNTVNCLSLLKIISITLFLEKSYVVRPENRIGKSNSGILTLTKYLWIPKLVLLEYHDVIEEQKADVCSCNHAFCCPFPSTPPHPYFLVALKHEGEKLP